METSDEFRPNFPFELDRPIAFIDLETTGIRVHSDQIVEIAVLRIEPSGEIVEKVRRFCPGIPINPQATEVHGISNADVAGEAPFARTAKSLDQFLKPCDLAGFNIRRFDLPLLIAEFKRVGIKFRVEGRRVIDAQQIFHHEEPRTLQAAAVKYLGKDYEEAHTALADVRTTASVLVAQLGHYSHLPRDLEGLNAYCNDVGPVNTGVSDWFTESDGILVFRKGKHSGMTLDQIATQEPGYLEWMLENVDPDDSIRKLLYRALDRFD